MTADNLGAMDTIYAENVRFADPAGEVYGREKLRAHFASLLSGADFCAFAFDGAVQDGDEVALFWRMTLAARRLNNGQQYEVPGASRLLFGGGGKVVMHRDYFDMGALLYERLPIVGAAARALRRRMAARQ